MMKVKLKWVAYCRVMAHALDKETYFVIILSGDVKHLFVFVAVFTNDTCPRPSSPQGVVKLFPGDHNLIYKHLIYTNQVHYKSYYPAKWHSRFCTFQPKTVVLFTRMGPHTKRVRQRVVNAINRAQNIFDQWIRSKSRTMLRICFILYELALTRICIMKL